MLKCIRIRSLQTGVRRTHNAGGIYQGPSIKQQGLSPKFANPISFEEAGRSSGPRVLGEGKDVRPQIPSAKITKINPEGMMENTLDRKHVSLNAESLRSRLSPVFRVPFNEGPFYN